MLSGPDSGADGVWYIIMKGLIFAIEEFAVFDGSGIRVNVFFKGCPLRCKWCHNPEGLENKVRIVKNPNNCINCGICTNICPSPDNCKLCEKCIINCPMGLIRTSGKWVEAEALAKQLLKYEPLLLRSGGGLTFSGGEVLMQPEFLCEILDRTKAMHRVIETSGYCSTDKWKEVLRRVDFVYYDLKIMDSEKHKEYTGVSNELILENARELMATDIPFSVRVPFIRGVNTDARNITALCELVKDAKTLSAVELLTYNALAGAKYKLVGREYEYSFEKPTAEETEAAAAIFNEYGICCIIQH